ncbi:DNA topoisomerase [Xanthocytophaga flava]|uniref:DNA topoisomerase n=1 Tax=Xanthocytophaga flava TaxID=3048013 RepID=UPI0028D8567D|nr:DNA topoisomerase [Xanthocytophaga flavus]MDJ1470275.1 DNA topoisomerase [Xanthocytophaga flavus]
MGLDYKNTKRVTFQEITESEIKQAISSPRVIDLNLVLAQESRRAIDRLVGYQISPVLWKKLESGLSAGRVQSVALKLCVEREKNILGFIDKSTFQISAFFHANKSESGKSDLLKAKKKEQFEVEINALSYLQSSSDKIFSISDVSTKPIEKNPQPPYSTSTLQQDGVKKLKLDVKKVMDLAQKLFEAGHITYMRTDSLNLSDSAIQEAKNQISSQYGLPYFQQRNFKSKAGSQEAHEAIRPTHWEKSTAGDTDDEKNIYDLIYRRALASQMKAAKFDETTIIISSNVPNDLFYSSARINTFDGYLKVYQEEEEEEQQENTIQPVIVGQSLELNKMEANQNYVKPPKRFDQASLVAELEKKQIGRPSTYASILNTILSKNYVKTGDSLGHSVKAICLTLENGSILRSEKRESIGADKKKLIPTQVGTKLSNFLELSFPGIVNYNFTCECEQLLDEIAEGKKNFKQIVTAFDKQLTAWLEKVDQTYTDVEKEQMREIGMYEGEPIFIGNGKFSYYLKHNGISYSIQTTNPDQVSLEQAIQAIHLKRENKQLTLGSYEGKPIVAGIGKSGIYILHKDKFYNLSTAEAAASNNKVNSSQTLKNAISHLTIADAILVIEKPRQEAKDKASLKGKNQIAVIGKKYKIIKSVYGLYVTDGKLSASLPKTVSEETAKEWTEEQCKKAICWKKKNKGSN